VAAVRAEHGYLRVDSKRIPLLSGELQFWRIDPSGWQSALRAVSSERLPIVSTYLSWRRHALEPDAPLSWRHDERLDLRRFLALCATHRLLVQLKPGPWICAEERNGGYPDWLLADDELLALDAQGRPLVGYAPPFQHPVPCYMHQRYLEHARRWIHGVHTQIHDFIYPRGPVVLIQLDNEPSYCFRDGMYEADYHPVALAAFARWSLERHGSLDGVERAWQLELDSEARIEPPREPIPGVKPGSGRWHHEHDWISFREWLLAEHLRRLRDGHEESGARETAFTVNFNVHPVDGVPQSPRAIASATNAVVGMDHYYKPPLTCDDLLVLGRAIAHTRAAGEPLPWSPEIQAGIWRSPGERVTYPDPTPEEQALYYFAALAFGLKGLNFYMLVNRDNWQFAPIEPSGTATPMLDAVRKVIRLFEQLPEFASLKPISPVALAWQMSYAHDAYASASNDGQRRFAHETTLAAFSTLTSAGYLARIWHTEDELSADIRAVVTPAASYMGRAEQERLVSHAKAGVAVMLVGIPPMQDENGQRCETLAAAVDAGEVLCLTKPAELPDALQTAGIEAPVCVDRNDNFAVLQESPDGHSVLFVLNLAHERSNLLLSFADNRFETLRPLVSDDPVVPVVGRVARIELKPQTARVFQADT
jgi:Glycosyl hydrolases family 35